MLLEAFKNELQIKVTTDQVVLLMTSVSVSDASAAWDEHDLKLRNVSSYE